MSNWIKLTNSNISFKPRKKGITKGLKKKGPKQLKKSPLLPWAKVKHEVLK